MAGACTENSNIQVDRRRQLAWQISLSLPLLLLVFYTAIRFQPMAAWQTYCGLLLFALVSASAVTDLRWCKIPNWLTYSAFGWAIVANLFTTFVSPQFAEVLGTVGLVDSLAGAFIPFFFMLVIFSLTGGGAGDVKLTAAMGALLGLSQVIEVILLSFVFAGAFALIRAVWVLGPVSLALLIYRKIGSWLLPVWIEPPTQEQTTFMRQAMPLGPSFALGAGVVLLGLDVQQFFNF